MRSERASRWLLAVLLAALLAAGLLLVRGFAGRRVPERARLVREEGGRTMASVVKVLELVGESERDWDDAVRNAVAEAAKTVRNITGIEVCNMTANVRDGRISEYRANVKVAFVVDPDRAGA